MSDAIIVAIVAGGFTLAGTIISGVISSVISSKKSEKATAVAQAVTETKLDELTRDVRDHNNFAQRIPVVEQSVTSLEKRVSNLEQYHKAPVN